MRRYRDEYGCDHYLLADKLDIAYGARLSPGAIDFLIDVGTNISYKKSADLLARNGSRVKPTTVMECLREAGKLCAE